MLTAAGVEEEIGALEVLLCIWNLINTQRQKRKLIKTHFKEQNDENNEVDASQTD